MVVNPVIQHATYVVGTILCMLASQYHQEFKLAIGGRSGDGIGDGAKRGGSSEPHVWHTTEEPADNLDAGCAPCGLCECACVCRCEHPEWDPVKTAAEHEEQRKRLEADVDFWRQVASGASGFLSLFVGNYFVTRAQRARRFVATEAEGRALSGTSSAAITDRTVAAPRTFPSPHKLREARRRDGGNARDAEQSSSSESDTSPLRW